MLTPAPTKHPHPPTLHSPGADRLKRQIALVARQNRATGRDSPLRPLLDATGAVNVPKALMSAITNAVQEDGELADAASEQVGGLLFHKPFIGCLMGGHMDVLGCCQCAQGADGCHNDCSAGGWRAG
jgi:hypothetical protein